MLDLIRLLGMGLGELDPTKTDPTARLSWDPPVVSQQYEEIIDMKVVAYGVEQATLR